MGKSYTAISFFSDEITIRPHTATLYKHVSKPVSIRNFADGQPVSLERCDETGEYVVRRFGGDFMEGPEVTG